MKGKQMKRNEKRNRFVALTTIDNPFDPINDFRNWWCYDALNLGYNSCQYLARKVDLIQGKRKNIPEKEMDAIIEKAIDQIIEEDFLHIYKKKEYFEDATEDSK